MHLASLNEPTTPQANKHSAHQQTHLRALLRPGEQVQVDTTRLDVLALFDDGRLARPELTIAIDVATRAILAAVICCGGSKVVADVRCSAGENPRTGPLGGWMVRRTCPS